MTVRVLLLVSVLTSVAGAEPLELRVNDDFGTAYQGYPACAGQVQGSYLVVWEDARSGGVDIYLQRFAPTGERQGGNLRVNDSVPPEQYAPDVAADPLGQGWVAWQDFRASGYPQNGDIYLQRVAADGSLLDLNRRVNDDGAQVTQKEPAVAANAAEVLIVWSDLRRGHWDIYAQRYDHNGQTLGANFRVNDDPDSAPQHAPDLGVLADGHFVAVWYDTRSGSEEIYCQLVAPAGGGLVGGNVRVSDNAGSSRPRFPTVSAGPADGFTMAWQDFRDGAYPLGARIYAQSFGATGSPVGTNKALVPSDFDQGHPQMAADAIGNRVVVWEEKQGDTDRVLQGKFPEGAEPMTAEPLGLDSVQGSRTRPNLALGRGQVCYAWTDQRRGNFDVYLEIEEFRFPTFRPMPAALHFDVPLRAPEWTPPETVLVAAVGTVARSVRWGTHPLWLRISPDSGTTPASFVISITSDWDGADSNFLIWVMEASDSLEKEAVSVTVTALVPELVAEPQAISFDLDSGVSAEQVVSVTNINPGPLVWHFEGADPPWEVERLPGDSLRVSLDPTGLAASSWNDTLWLIDSLASNSPMAVPLIARLDLNPPVQPQLQTEPIAAGWFAPLGHVMAESLFVRIRTLPDTVIAWTITDCPAWLYVSDTAGLTPGVVVLRANSDTLALGVYWDSLAVRSEEAANNPLWLPVMLTVDVASEVGENPSGAGSRELIVYPNPFNASVLAEWDQIEEGPYRLAIFDVLGRRVHTLAGRARPGEPTRLRWRPAPGLAAGTYIVRLETDTGVAVRRMIYLK